MHARRTLPAPPATVEQWGLFEAAFPGPREGNPFLDAEFGARLTQGKRAITVDGFYDGDGIYRFRFMPDRPGTWRFVTHSNHEELDNHAGTFTATAPSPGNHGPVSVAHTHHFAHADGTYYSCVGTTSYVWALQPAARMSRTLRTLRTAGFNKLRMCVFPKHYKWNTREPAFYPFAARRRPADADLPTDKALSGWRWDFSRFEPAYFQNLDRQIAALGKLGIEADIILFHPYDRWGFSQMSEADDERYLRFAVARWGAYRHVWWSMANEYDLFKKEKNWDRLGRLVAKLDPFHHPRSIHNCWVPYDHSRAWITHASIQLFDQPLWQDLKAWRETFRKPIVIDENRYEGDVPIDWGSLPGTEMVQRFWLAAVAGAYNGHSESYLHSDDVIWWSHGGVLRGESWKRLRFLRSILESGPARGLTPIFKRTSPWTAKKTDDWVLCYFGIHQPSGWEARLPPGKSYKLELIDTWRMTVSALEGTFRHGDQVALPGRSYLAIRATAA